MNNINAINLALNELREFSRVWLCGRVRGRSVLCHFVLDNEHIHQDSLNTIQNGIEEALRSLRENKSKDYI